MRGPARVTGLGQGLSGGLAGWRAPQAVRDRGKIIAGLVVTLAPGADCLADIAVLRAQQELAGPAASGPVVARLISALAADAPAGAESDPQGALPLVSEPGRWLTVGSRAGLGRRCCSRCPAGGGSAGSGSSARWTRPRPDFLSVHELAGPEVLEEPGYQAAISTPWRDRVVASALCRERRVFGLRNAISV